LAVSTTSKSPKDVLTEAWSVASQVFPKYSHKNSPKKFTQGQLFACLVLKNFLKLDHRGLQHLLVDCSDLTAAIEMKSVPHFTTFQKASRKLLAAKPIHRLLDETVSRMMGQRKYVQLAAVDSTGLESTTASPYFVKRRSRQENPWKTVVYHRYPKLAIVCNTFDQFVIAFDTYRGPKPDVDEFKDLIEQTKRRVGLRILVADAGYDSESNHEFARQVIGARTIIPAKHGRPTDKPARGKYRRLMQTRFDKHTYGQRAQVETAVSMLKRRQGNHIRGKSNWSQTRDLRLMVLTHNIMILWRNILFYRATSSQFLDCCAQKRPNYRSIR
jgi:Transposase DDE domain